MARELGPEQARARDLLGRSVAMARELGPEQAGARDLLGHDRLQAPEQTLEQEDNRQCWICLQSEATEMIAPCHCAGTMKWVHRPCLNRWRVDATNPKNFTNCRHCDYKFRLVLRRDPTQDESTIQKRKQRFLFKTVSSFITMCILLQVALVLFAMIIRALDPKEELVKLFDFHQVENTPPAGEGDYLNAFRHHKSTYYVAAVLLALFVTGVSATIKCCCCSGDHGPCGDCNCDPCPRHVDARGVGLGGMSPVDQYLCMHGCGDCCQWGGDCCFFCGRGESCPDCNMDGTCLGDCCGSGAVECCSCPSGGDSGDGACAIILIIAAIVVIAFILVGLIFLFMAIVVWFQKVVVRYLQISELRQLAGEYVVDDLSGESPVSEAPPKSDMEKPAPSAPPQESMPDNPSAPPCGSAIFDADLIHQSLRRDLQAVYGRDMVF